MAATYGGTAILVNNAFDPSAVFSSVIDLSIEQLQRNFDMGPIAYLRMMQACYPHLKASGAGRLINFGSAAGIVALLPYAPCGMAKEAVRALTRMAAREWGPDNIMVNNMLPVADTWGGADVPRPMCLLDATAHQKTISHQWFYSLRARMHSSSRATA